MSDDDAEGEDPGAAPRWVPGSRLSGLAAAGLPLALLDGGSGLGFAAALTFDAALLAGAALEGRALSRAAPEARRRMDARLVVGVDNVVTVQLRNPGARTLRVRVRDDLPDGWAGSPDELEVTLPPHSRRELSYTVRPGRRGRFRFGDLHLRITGRAGLGAAIVAVRAATDARVYPNVLGPRRYELAARLGGLRQAGFRRVRATGGGGEFEQLAEYVPGQPYRDVDWKATAKRGRPVVRLHQQERSQQVLLCIDCGRMMAPKLDGISKLDHAINAALMLAYVALRNGDRVGLVVFADVVKTFVPPGRGPGQYRRLLEALYEVEASSTHVDFRRLVEILKLRVPRRALLVMFSDLLDQDHAMPLAEHAGLLRRKHLPVCVTMQDPVAGELADRPAVTELDVYRRAAAADVLAERDAVKAHLAKSAVDVVEAPPGELSVATVNRYLEIKARHRL